MSHQAGLMPGRSREHKRKFAADYSFCFAYFVAILPLPLMHWLASETTFDVRKRQQRASKYRASSESMRL
jgi:hypothetical protein